MDKHRVMERLREAMDRSGVKAADIARVCGITNQAVSNWWRSGAVSRDNLAKAARLCGTSLDELMGEKKSKPATVDTDLLKEAIGDVERAIKSHNANVSIDRLASLIAETYESLLMAEQAKKAVSLKLAQIIEDTKTEK